MGVLEDGPLASFGIHLDMNEDYALLKVCTLANVSSHWRLSHCHVSLPCLAAMSHCHFSPPVSCDLHQVAFLIMCFAYVGMSMGKWTARFMTTRSPHFAARVASDLKKESAVKAMGGKKAK
mmetsp:Transcript_45968/g.107329  ORF Transcript_45968/g.107329 Transcript_45968/m.107329 type:complete len:121 (-) Transcript_45968:398-760(-)